MKQLDTYGKEISRVQFFKTLNHISSHLVCDIEPLSIHLENSDSFIHLRL